MKILILHAGKTGATERCAGLLATELSKNEKVQCEVFPVRRAPASLHGYDKVVLGSAVRMGMLHKDMRRFIKANAAQLLRSEAAYFCCCCFTDKADEYFETNLGHALVTHAVCTSCFGGEMELSKQKGFDKLITKMVVSAMAKDPEATAAPAIDEAAIAEMAKKLTE